MTRHLQVFEELPASLAHYQTASGAFRTGDEPDLEATANGVFVASLFNSPSVRSRSCPRPQPTDLSHWIRQVNLEAARAYASSVQNGDSGFGNKNGLASDLESTRYGHLSLLSLIPCSAADRASAMPSWFSRSLRLSPRTPLAS